MEKFSFTFGFREPYQVLVDADFVADTSRFAMDLVPALERTLRGKVKPMITQCCMRHLYARKSEPGMNKVIEFAKTIERRRCGHHPDEFAEPLHALECLPSVVDPKKKRENKHKYVVASQDGQVRRLMRQIPGVPLVYVSRSVMILEPMTDLTIALRNREERAKLRAEIKESGLTGKRKWDDIDDGEGKGHTTGPAENIQPPTKKKKKNYGRKGPNPLSVKKSAKKIERSNGSRRPKDKIENNPP